MTHRKRTKDTRMRGTGSHGWGDKKKRRNFGHRGGKGLAGRYTGSKKPSVWAQGRQHKKGFVSISSVHEKVINVGDINIMIEKEKFEKKGSIYDVNLKTLKFTKLLSKGKMKYPANIVIASATEKAADKINKAGGTIVK